MNRLVCILTTVFVFAFFAAPVLGEEATGTAPGGFANDTEKTSYALGMDIGQNLGNLPIEIDFKTFVQGIEDSYTGKKPRMTKNEVSVVKRNLAMKLQKKRMEERQVQGEKNKKEGTAFLAENKKKKDVVTTSSGLQYTVIKMGDGPKPTADNTVKVNYKGTLLDGTEFDSSYKRGQPATFPVKGVIKGWTEALQLMPVGSTWKLFIPADLAYGDRGAGPMIGPGATLIFEVELLSIEK